MIIEEKKILEHIPNHIEYAAYTCYEAACYRNILHEEELKTIILQTGKQQPFAVHLPGDREVDFQQLPQIDKPIKFFDLTNYAKVGLQKGTVNPFNIINILPLKAVLICQSIFRYKKMYTNDGTLYGTYIIAPEVLLEIYKNNITGNFSIKTN